MSCDLWLVCRTSQPVPSPGPSAGVSAPTTPDLCFRVSPCFPVSYPVFHFRLGQDVLDSHPDTRSSAVSFLIKATMQDGISVLIGMMIGILSISVIHLVILVNTTRYCGIPSASRCSPLMATVGTRVVSVLSVRPRPHISCTIGTNACTVCVRAPSGGPCRLRPFV